MDLRAVDSSGLCLVVDFECVLQGSYVEVDICALPFHVQRPNKGKRREDYCSIEEYDFGNFAGLKPG